MLGLNVAKIFAKKSDFEAFKAFNLIMNKLSIFLYGIN